MSTRSEPRYRIRLAEAMAHTVRYDFEGKARLARDCGLSKSEISRLVAGQVRPSYRTVQLVVGALERELGRRIDPSDLISYSGEDWRRSVCDVCGCRGCLPDGALREDGTIDPAYAGVRPGAWKEFRALGGEVTLYGEGA